MSVHITRPAPNGGKFSAITIDDGRVIMVETMWFDKEGSQVDVRRSVLSVRETMDKHIEDMQKGQE
jgi:hypothetical protein